MDVDPDVLDRMKKIKAEHGFKTTSEAARFVLDHYDKRGQRAGSDEDEREESGEPVKKRKINVREPLYLLELLSECVGMLQYCTGFGLGEVGLLIRRFKEVGGWSSILVLGPLRPSAH